MAPAPNDPHNTLCGTFQNFQQRPSDDHYRSIYFPPNETRPRFIWLLWTGTRGGQFPDSDDLARYVAGQASGRLRLEEYHGPNRSYSNFVVIQHDDNMFSNRQPANRCLLRMIGAEADRWLGDYVAHGYKYLYSDDPDAYDAADQDLVTDDFPLIALDLDTTSLGPIVAYLKWRAQTELHAFPF
ncbi:hypothetical protein SNOG_09760 [Parastagonospora nodorum SN15]|uniref:Uncharacterized protein n=2 Tax=Phaeosphaeria nodorum (strain SN15 / ATCC MYA-4574 / FGSC 10173) TaxID=321614 RepID=Q0UEQ4_PHANO|nr:hypothetical protein SNOG_09760 [Parastagonospora nodorum SN15]EAT83025.1 hypothetical protein SNOG_09760 [Parastagonospora nodorum SN15]